MLAEEDITEDKTVKPLVLSMEEKVVAVRHHDGAMSLQQLRNNGLPELIEYDFGNSVDIKLREIQELALRMTTDELRKGFTKIILSLPPGAGKTILAMTIMKRALEKNPNQTILFCVNRDALITNAKDEIESLLQVKVGVIQGNTPMNLELPIQIASLQTIENRLDTDKDDITPLIMSQLNINMVFNDEAHYNYNGLRTIISMIEEKGDKLYLFGLTATAFTTHLADIYQTLVKPMTMRKLIQQGVLVDYKLISYRGLYTDNIKVVAGEFQDKSAGEEVEKFLVIGDPAKDWADNSETYNKFTIIYCPTVSSCEAMYEHWIDSDVIDSNKIGIMHSKSDKNEETLDKFKRGIIRVVISVNMLREGVDVPHASVMMLFSPLATNKSKKDEPNSITTYLQRHGRATRSYEGGFIVNDVKTGEQSILKSHQLTDFHEVIEELPKKEYAVIIDYTGTDRFAPPDEIDERYTELQKRKTRKEKKEEADEIEGNILDSIENDNVDDLAPATICGNCGSIIRELPQCDFCAFSVKKVISKVAPGVEIEYVDGEAHITHVPEGYKSKIEKRKDSPNTKIRVDYKNPTKEQRMKILTAINIRMDEKHISPEKQKSMRYAKLVSIIGKKNMPNSAQGFSALKKSAVEYEKQLTLNHHLLPDMDKYLSKVAREEKKFWNKKK